MDIRSVGSVKQPAPVSVENMALPAATKPATHVETAGAVSPPVDVHSTEQLNDALKKINKAIQSMSPGVEFTVDSESQRTVVKVVDQLTQEVLRQMPSEEALAISKALDKLQGLLIRQEA